MRGGGRGLRGRERRGAPGVLFGGLGGLGGGVGRGARQLRGSTAGSVFVLAARTLAGDTDGGNHGLKRVFGWRAALLRAAQE